MDVMTAVRELGKAIQADEAYARFHQVIKENDENIVGMAARKSEGPLSEDEVVLLKKLANLLISSKIDEIKDK